MKFLERTIPRLTFPPLIVFCAIEHVWCLLLQLSFFALQAMEAARSHRKWLLVHFYDDVRFGLLFTHEEVWSDRETIDLFKRSAILIQVMSELFLCCFAHPITLPTV